MIIKDKSYKISFVLAVIFHLLLGTVLFFKFTTQINQPLPESTNIVKATVVTNDIEAELAKIQAAKQRQLQLQQQKKQERLARQQKIEQQKIARKKTEALLKQRLAIEQKQEQQQLQKKIRAEKQTIAKQKEQMLQKLMQQQLTQERKQLAKAAGANRNLSEIEKYKALIIQTISQQWIVPDGVDKNATCILLITLAPGGNVIGVQLLQESGNGALDRSAKTAVLKASPLPVPKNLALFDSFRTIKLIVHPKDMEYR